MDAFLRSLRDQSLAGMVMPSHRFFTPTATFWETLAQYPDIGWIDAGTGSGELPEEARSRGFNMLGLDLAPRMNARPDILYRDAEDFDYTPATWLLMCRPDHSGWAYDTLCKAQQKGAGVAYVGLERNRLLDLDDLADYYSLCIEEVGEDGEHLWLFLPGTLQKLYS